MCLQTISMFTLQGSYTYSGNIFNTIILIVKAKKKHKRMSTFTKTIDGWHSIPCKVCMLMSYYDFVCRYPYMYVQMQNKCFTYTSIHIYECMYLALRTCPCWHLCVHVDVCTHTLLKGVSWGGLDENITVYVFTYEKDTHES